MSGLERLSSETAFEGKIAKVRLEEWRLPDGSTAKREVVAHPGAVGIVCHDGTDLLLVRQPREPVGEASVLELPAGKLDEEGESPLETAKRELAEEVGRTADEWELLHEYWSSPGFSDERVHVFLATGLTEVERPAADDSDQIELVRHPLADLDGLLAQVQDGKTLVGLLALKLRLQQR